MEKGYLNIVLHAHLPFVKHPEYNETFEERWLYEALTETYIPLLTMMKGLLADGVTTFRLTMSLTPPLVCMLSDPLLQDRYYNKLVKLLELAEKELERTKKLGWPYYDTALMYHTKLKQAYHLFEEQYHRNIITAFKEMQDAGVLEIITCGATHGFLPLLSVHPEAVRAQIKVAVQTHTKHFGKPPAGIWLPECGYYPGVDNFLKDEGIRFFFLETHGLLHADPRPRYGIFAPVYCPSGVAAFGRDAESSKQVWSADEGYPGDFDYREFYKDIGFDLPMDYIAPYIHESGQRVDTGFKYYRVTGKGIDLGDKQPYVPQWAIGKLASHSANFMFNRQLQVRYLYEIMGKKPIITAPYDAELFGHWWYEGPAFLEMLFRKIIFDQTDIRLITAREYLEMYPVNQIATPSFSSWGYKGYNEYWLNTHNDWIYRHLHKAAERMIFLANTIKLPSSPLMLRALNQAARELLLAQSSDWAFIMTSGTTIEYANKRTRLHLSRFFKIYDAIMTDDFDEKWLSDIENKDSIFSDINYLVYASRKA